MNQAGCYRGPIKIVSGGQTGVDRAALDWAIDAGIQHGGWCPRGRRSEDGRIDDRYQLTETAQSTYPPRTRRNIIDSDVTLVIHRGPPSDGTALTIRIARELDRPVCLIDLHGDPDGTTQMIDFLCRFRPEVLNVAGPRESGSPGIGRETVRVLTEVWQRAGWTAHRD